MERRGNTKNLETHYKNTPVKKGVRVYRPVALTIILCKIFERLTNKRLVWYLEKEKKIDDRLFGFRKQRSTIDAISKIITNFSMDSGERR